MIRRVYRSVVDKILEEIPKELRARLRMPPKIEAFKIDIGEDRILAKIIIAIDSEYHNDNFIKGQNWRKDCRDWLGITNNEIDMIWDLMLKHGWNENMEDFK